MNKLTIVLGKNIGLNGDLWYRTSVAGLVVGYPEMRHPSPGVVIPNHPDGFVPQTLEYIKELLTLGCKDVYLWTLSEYLVSAIAQAVGDGTISYEQVEVRLYADDNGSYRDFVISHEGVFGEGWPIGWFMPA